MAVIVKHRETSQEYIWLGTGFGAYKSSRPSRFLGELFPHEEEGEFRVVAVCDRFGQILWFYSAQLVVVEVDGETPSELVD
ncbi:MAG: hypothetical protein F6J90_28050 [Moorea sp. SIOASIH]|uniref:hypothetical protein n=1 Tax=Moorena sp. SIOASIH TaxID=2607817 RepID=UPI0013B96C5D|nr:hypothetical protein [Moorena sp. SIOASIH]NEO39978.1 hypothetical protein [Moorena sp. SIOASIH]